MADVHHIRTGDDITPHKMKADVVQTLEVVLARAKDGQHTGVLIVTACEDGTFNTDWAGLVSSCEMIGQLVVVQHRIAQHINDHQTEWS